MTKEKQWIKKAKEEWGLRISPKSTQQEQEEVLISMLSKQREDMLAKAIECVQEGNNCRGQTIKNIRERL